MRGLCSFLEVSRNPLHQFFNKLLPLIGEEQNEKEGIVTDLKFGDCTFIKKGKKYLSVQFAIGDWWSREFPTEILAPPIYSEYTNDLVKQSMSIIKDTSKAE